MRFVILRASAHTHTETREIRYILRCCCRCRCLRWLCAHMSRSHLLVLSSGRFCFFNLLNYKCSVQPLPHPCAAKRSHCFVYHLIDFRCGHTSICACGLYLTSIESMLYRFLLLAVVRCATLSSALSLLLSYPKASAECRRNFYQ